MRNNKKMKNNGKVGGGIILAAVFLILGFILSYSYSLSKNDPRESLAGNSVAEHEGKYRDELIKQMERNKELTEELTAKREQIREYEKSFSEGEESYSKLAEEAKDLRLLLGSVPAKGEGLKVKLEDAEYDPATMNPNEYIVHESHIFKVIHELRISGAQAIAVNGQRIDESTYIKCTGPVITIGTNQYPAPFTIEAIGDTDVLLPAIQLKGGVFDQLIHDNIVVTLEESNSIRMSPMHTEGS
ncbi:DUF881 domain-containing protein [Chungangia koreensis]|uniref:DUF881 domain-containing protein n=1 Tax=Chungangia koreensis TaxID=752657 RepID=A0ABV8X053_9LACT